MQDAFQLPALSIFLSSQNILYQLNFIWILVFSSEDSTYASAHVINTTE